MNDFPTWVSFRTIALAQIANLPRSGPDVTHVFHYFQWPHLMIFAVFHFMSKSQVTSLVMLQLIVLIYEPNINSTSIFWSPACSPLILLKRSSLRLTFRGTSNKWFYSWMSVTPNAANLPPPPLNLRYVHIPPDRIPRILVSVLAMLLSVS